MNQSQQKALATIQSMLAVSPISVVPDLTLLRANGSELDNKQRVEALEQSRAGKQIELMFPAQVYAQGDEPNLKFVRVKDSRLRSFAKSGRAQPFLRDHGSHNQSLRGGTIQTSVGEKRADLWTVQQTILATAPWSVQGLLEGNIDRFSVGIRRTGEIQYRHSKETIEDWPRHWPGSTIEVDGKKLRVEWVYTDAVLTETSAVNMPAVLQTSITEKIRSVLSAVEMPVRSFGGIPAEGDSAPAPTSSKETLNMDPKILEMLGLSAGDGQDKVLSAIQTLKTENAKLQVAVTAANDARINSALEEAKKDGRVPIHRNEKGEVVMSKLEKTLRDLAGLNMGAFTEMLSELPKTRNVERSLQSEATPAGDPVAAPGADLSDDDDIEAQYLAEAKANPEMVKQAKLRGITVEQMVKGAKLADEHVGVPLSIVRKTAR